MGLLFWLLFVLMEASALRPLPNPSSAHAFSVTSLLQPVGGQARAFGFKASLGEGLSFGGVDSFQILNLVLGQTGYFSGTGYILAAVYEQITLGLV